MPIESTIVKALVSFLEQHPAFNEGFKIAFNGVQKTGILEQYNIHSLDDYFTYYDNFLKWTPRENAGGTLIYENLCLFYFLLDQAPVMQMQTPITPFGGWTWLSQWIIDYAMEVGTFMNSPESINADTLATFYKADNYHMEDYIVPPGGWKTFNEFFHRHIKPEVRPIAELTNPNVIVSPADSAFGGSWPVDDGGKTEFTSKGIPWSISQLLEDTVYGGRFIGGKFMHSFLNTTDYHRQHAPVAGRVIEAKVIPGLCYLEVKVKVDAHNKPKFVMRRRLQTHPVLLEHARKHHPNESVESSLDAPDSPGYQFLQARGLVIIDSPELGLVAVLPIGMAQVSSVTLTVKAGDYVEKGQEISYFSLGGSDIVMVFEAKANVTFPDPTHPATHYNFGTQIATADPK